MEGRRSSDCYVSFLDWEVLGKSCKMKELDGKNHWFMKKSLISSLFLTSNDPCKTLTNNIKYEQNTHKLDC